MAPMPLGLFVKKWQPKVGIAEYDILFAYFVVEAKSKNGSRILGVTPRRDTLDMKYLVLTNPFLKIC